MHKQKRPSRVTLLAESTQDRAADSELLALCSGNFETQSDSLPSDLRSRRLSDSSSFQGVRELLGVKQPRPAGLSKLLGSTGFMSGDTDKSTLGSPDMNEMLGLCSGAFPSTQTQGKTDAAFSKFGTSVGNGHTAQENGGSSSSESESEGKEDRESDLLSWAQRQKKLAAMFARAGSGEGEVDDDAMPALTRKRKRVRPKPKPTKG